MLTAWGRAHARMENKKNPRRSHGGLRRGFSYLLYFKDGGRARHCRGRELDTETKRTTTRDVLWKTLAGDEFTTGHALTSHTSSFSFP